MALPLQGLRQRASALSRRNFLKFSGAVVTTSALAACAAPAAPTAGTTDDPTSTVPGDA